MNTSDKPKPEKIAGLRVSGPPAPPKPHVVTMKSYKCSECSFFSPQSVLVFQHIQRQHPEQEKEK